jgi:hypothetical protein
LLAKAFLFPHSIQVRFIYLFACSRHIRCISGPFGQV